MYYKECPFCGCNLDPEEKCDCQDKKKNREELIRSLLLRQPDGQLVLKEAVYMTYESLMIANQTITKIEVKGKEYAEVNQRIRVFRMLYPNGSIETNIESLEKGICVMSAVVKDDFGSVLGVGHAYEKEDSSFINKTSYIENCETSAVGRALGMCGIGIDTSVASADEVLNAIKQQEGMSLISDAQYNTLMKCIPNHNQTVENVCNFFKVKDLRELTVKHFMILMNKMGEQ
nr:MAG TPA: restriction alleviation protein [Caudoviricetes sp.]